MHGTEALQVDIQFRVVPNACALLQSALKEHTATGPASERRLYQARLEGGYVR